MTRVWPTTYVAFILCAFPLACGRADIRRPDDGVAGRLRGAQPIPSSALAAIAQSRGLSIDESLRSVAADVRLADVATEKGIAATPAASWALTAALARADLESIGRSARDMGPVQPFEREKLRVIHAVVRRGGGMSESRGPEIAREIRSAVIGGRTAEQFEADASRVARDYPGLRIERLPVFDITGATGEGGGFDSDFVAAAFELKAPGDTSEVSETRFGWHVIRLLERIAPDSDPPAGFLQDVIEARARKMTRALLQSQRRQVRVDVSRGAELEMAEAVAGLQ